MSNKSGKSRGLGRGLSALMADVTPEAQNDSPNSPRRPDAKMPVEQIRPNPDQPRRSFDPDSLAELAASIREKGIIQPLIVRPDPKDKAFYQIVAGERRWRAAQTAQLHEVPVIIRDFDDTEMLEIAIIENIQRADLNAVDEATGYRHLMDRFGHTQDQMATALGKSRSHIANLLRLLTLPNDVQQLLADGALSAGHARALVGHPQASALARQILQGGLSVRQTENLVKAGRTPTPKRSAQPRSKDADTVQIENEMTAAIGMKVVIDHQTNGEGGKLTVSYKSLDQLDDLLRNLSGG